MKKNRHILLTVCIVLICAVMAFCVFMIFRKTAPHRESVKTYELLSEEYCPHGGISAKTTDAAESRDPEEGTEPTGEKDEGNPEIVRLCADYPNAVGWLTIPNTAVDYPFAHSKDNVDFLHAGLDGKYLFDGTLFLDCHCAPDFSDQNSIIYGHNMNTGNAMFQSLNLFKDKEFFEKNTAAYIYLPDRTLELETFALLIVDAVHEEQLYNRELRDDYIQYVSEHAKYFREAPAEGERIITLSTCSYEFSDARLVLLCRIKN